LPGKFDCGFKENSCGPKPPRRLFSRSTRQFTFDRKPSS